MKYELLPFPVDYEIWIAGCSQTYHCEMRTVPMQLIIIMPPPAPNRRGHKAMIMSDVCLSEVCRVHRA